jgi:hypothetical protein
MLALQVFVPGPCGFCNLLKITSENWLAKRISAIPRWLPAATFFAGAGRIFWQMQ